VGVLDIDIHGPSVPKLLRIEAARGINDSSPHHGRLLTLDEGTASAKLVQEPEMTGQEKSRWRGGPRHGRGAT
jgi:Mrp family chromosome partitioning ATPase